MGPSRASLRSSNFAWTKSGGKTHTPENDPLNRDSAPKMGKNGPPGRPCPLIFWRVFLPQVGFWGGEKSHAPTGIKNVASGKRCSRRGAQMGILGKSLRPGKRRRKKPGEHIDVDGPSGGSFSAVVVRVLAHAKVKKRCKNPHHLGDQKWAGWGPSWS